MGLAYLIKCHIFAFLAQPPSSIYMLLLLYFTISFSEELFASLFMLLSLVCDLSMKDLFTLRNRICQNWPATQVIYLPLVGERGRSSTNPRAVSCAGAPPDSLSYRRDGSDGLSVVSVSNTCTLSVASDANSSFSCVGSIGTRRLGDLVESDASRSRFWYVSRLFLFSS